MSSSLQTVDTASQRDDPKSEEEEELLPTPERSSVDRRSNIVSLIKLPPSPADSDIPMRQATSKETPPPSATIREERRITRPLERGTPGDQAIFSAAKTPEQKQLAKRKSQYYNDVFSSREPITSARERITGESPILADIRTNVIISDEYTFITDLSYNLSTRYQRPENSIIVTVAHSCCMLFGGNFDPAYTLTISALGSQLQPVTNKRNATLLAKALEECLGVAPNRGLIRFMAISEDNLATDGKTITGEIEELEKETAENNANFQKNLGTPSKTKRRHSIRSLRGANKNQLPTHNERETPTPPAGEVLTPPLPPLPSEKSPADQRAEKAQKMGRRKSFIATIFGK